MALLLSLMNPYIPTSAAQSATCVGGWNNIHWNNGKGVQGNSYINPNENAEAEFSWSVPDSAKEGDSFTFVLPRQLQLAPGAPREFPLLDGNSKVANAVWDGQTLTVTLTNYANTNYNVHGSVKVSLRWDQSVISENGYDSSADGLLQFSGCGQGGLDGVYPKAGPGGFTHETGKRGYLNDLYETKVNGKTNYVVHWVVAINGNTKRSDGANYFEVTDTPPEGLQFVCTDTTLPPVSGVNIYTYHAGSTEPLMGKILDASGVERGINDGYRIDCSPNQLTVTFPYAVYADSAPSLAFYTYTDQRPLPGETIKNTVDIAGKQYTGSVTIPNNSGNGTGEKGGFTIKKILEGNPPADHAKAFTFKYRCVGTTGTVKEGNVEVSPDGTYKHVVADIEKNMKCEVSEVLSGADAAASPHLSWKINGKNAEGKIVSFKTMDQGQYAIDLIATNTYDAPPPEVPSPKQAPFRIEKQITGEAPLISSLKDKKFAFTYACGNDKAETAFASINEPFISPKQYPIGTNCTITEEADSAQVNGYTWSHTLTPADGTITIAEQKNETDTVKVIASNHYTAKTGSFSITKTVNGAAKDDVKIKNAEYTFNYVCGANGERSGELKVKGGETVQGPEDLPVGSECTVSETEVNVPNGIEWTGGVTPSGKFVIAENKNFEVKANNSFNYVNGGFAILKTVAGTTANIAELEAKPYEFSYVCTPPNGVKIEKSLSITPGDTTHVTDIPVGSECTVTEVEQSMANTHWSVDFSGESIKTTKNSAIFTIPRVSDPAIVISAKNTFTQHVGGFSIEKTVKAENGITTPQSFNFSWTCGAHSGTTTVPVSKGIGAVEVAQDIPVGTECSVTELNAEVPGTTLVKQWENQNFKISQQSETVKVAVTNSYQKTFGGFEIVKKLKGTERDKAADKKFEFSYVCSKPDDESAPSVKGILHVIGEGKTEQVTTIPTGYECTIEEKEASIVGTRWTHSIEKNGKLTITENGAFHVVRAVNTYEKPHITPPIPWLPFVPLIPFIPLIPLIPMVVNPPHPAPPSSVPPAPADPQKPQDQKPTKRQLANTGLNLGGIALAVIILSGLGLFLIRRSTRKS